MKRYLLVLFATTSLLAEELTFVCDYEISYKNFAPTKSFIYWNGQKVDFEEYGIKNLCDQKRWEDGARRNDSNLNFKDSFCKEKERRTIVVNENSDKFKIDGKEFRIKNDIKNRECFDVQEGSKLCEYDENFVVFDENQLRISVLKKYQPEWCPVDMDMNDAFNIEDKETKDKILKTCFGLTDEAFRGKTIALTIDRSTLKYDQTIVDRRIFMRNGKLTAEQSRGYGYTSGFNWYEDEVGQCRLNRKQF